jgi:hypothetical protein
MSETNDEQKQEAPRPPEWLMNSIVVIVAIQVVILVWTIWHYDLRLWE